MNACLVRNERDGQFQRSIEITCEVLLIEQPGNQQATQTGAQRSATSPIGRQAYTAERFGRTQGCNATPLLLTEAGSDEEYAIGCPGKPALRVHCQNGQCQAAQ